MIVHSSEPVTCVGGADLGPDDLNIALTHAPRFIAADSGADHLLARNIVPEAVFGDFDSISAAAKAAFAERLHETIDQDLTDFQKTIARIEAPLILAIGFLGQRMDHSFAALSAATAAKGANIVFLGPEDVVVVVRDLTRAFKLPVGTPFAVLPLVPSVVSSAGLKWELASTSLSMTTLISSSNKTVAQDVQITVEGAVALTMPRSALAAAIDAVRAR